MPDEAHSRQREQPVQELRRGDVLVEAPCRGRSGVGWAGLNEREGGGRRGQRSADCCRAL